jgi:hypothetical protein
MVIPGGDIESQFDFERRRNSRQALWKIFHIDAEADRSLPHNFVIGQA